MPANGVACPAASPSTAGGSLRLLSINCGGAGSKLDRLIALLLYSEPDIVCLQEVGTLPAGSLAGLPYRISLGPTVLGGGLATLIHHRAMQPDSRLPAAPQHPHFLISTISLPGPLMLTVANTHLPPGLPPAEVRLCCTSIAAHLSDSPPGVRLICGDLNDELPPRRSTWLRTALSPMGAWATFAPPYNPGDPTNFVTTSTASSARELDWVLLDSTSLCNQGAPASQALALARLAISPHPCHTHVHGHQSCYTRLLITLCQLSSHETTLCSPPAHDIVSLACYGPLQPSCMCASCGQRSPCMPLELAAHNFGCIHICTSFWESAFTLTMRVVKLPAISACERTLLPGLSTHRALQCDLLFPASSLLPADPSGRVFRFPLATRCRTPCLLIFLLIVLQERLGILTVGTLAKGS
jgi:endonuclease/exonuclease/phosphatase family metal-dependent hydrolase